MKSRRWQRGRVGDQPPQPAVEEVVLEADALPTGAQETSNTEAQVIPDCDVIGEERNKAMRHADALRCELSTPPCDDAALPEGLLLGRLPHPEASLAKLLRDVLLELRPNFTKSRKASASSDMFEVGWSFLAADHDKVRCAEDLASFPRLRNLLEDSMDALGAGNDIAESHLNVICRRYTRGQGIPIHVDRPQMFCEDVYGFILHNTSDGALEFRRETSPGRPKQSAGRAEMGTVFRVPEVPGVCFRQRGSARYEWLHGLEPITRGERISVTWRWFTDEALETSEGRDAKRSSNVMKSGKQFAAPQTRGGSRHKGETRVADDGRRYTRQEFTDFYGESDAKSRWEEARRISSNSSAK